MIKINRWVVFIIYSISLLTSVAALAAQGDTTRVSVDSAGVQSDGHSMILPSHQTAGMWHLIPLPPTLWQVILTAEVIFLCMIPRKALPPV